MPCLLEVGSSVEEPLSADLELETQEVSKVLLLVVILFTTVERLKRILEAVLNSVVHPKPLTPSAFQHIQERELQRRL